MQRKYTISGREIIIFGHSLSLLPTPRKNKKSIFRGMVVDRGSSPPSGRALIPGWGVEDFPLGSGSEFGGHYPV